MLKIWFGCNKVGLLVKQAKLCGLDEDPAILTSLEYARAEAIALQIEEAIEPLCDELKIVGSIRRKKPSW